MIEPECALKICFTAARSLVNPRSYYLEDAVQEAYLFYLQHHNKFDRTRGTEAGYCYRCARWGILRWIDTTSPFSVVRRNGKGRLAKTEQCGFEDYMSITPVNEDKIDCNLLMYKAADNYKETMQLIINGFSFVEVADKFGITPQAVKKRLQYFGRKECAK